MSLAALASVAQDGATTDDENAILSLVLECRFNDGGYTVVEPQTTLGHYSSSDTHRLAQAKTYLKQEFRKAGHDIDALVDQLFQRNAAAAKLTLPSAPKKGYMVDTDRRFERYFEKDGGGWEKWRKEEPKAHGSTQVSRPAIDRNKHLVLVYKGTQADGLAGSGSFILYAHQDGKLRLLEKVMAWIS